MPPIPPFRGTRRPTIEDWDHSFLHSSRLRFFHPTGVTGMEEFFGRWLHGTRHPKEVLVAETGSLMFSKLIFHAISIKVQI